MSSPKFSVGEDVIATTSDGYVIRTTVSECQGEARYELGGALQQSYSVNPDPYPDVDNDGAVCSWSEEQLRKAPERGTMTTSELMESLNKKVTA